MSKRATITIRKQYVLADIDSLTYKRTDGVMSDQTDQFKNAVASDSEEELDKMLLHRFMEDRDAQIRARIAFCLVQDEVEELSATNDPRVSEPDFTYRINVPDHFTNDTVNALSRRIHQYLVDGSTYDWYSKQGLSYSVSSEQLDQMLTDIGVSLRKPFVKRPLQPFGPRF